MYGGGRERSEGDHQSIIQPYVPDERGRKSAEARTGELGQAATSKRIDGRRRKRKKNTLSVQKEHSPPPSSCLLLSLFPSSFGRILPEGKIFLLTKGRANEGMERPFKVRFRRLARMERKKNRLSPSRPTNQQSNRI